MTTKYVYILPQKLTISQEIQHNSTVKIEILKDQYM